MKTILVAPRLMDYGKWKAWLSTDSRIWGAGRSPYEAIGNCVNAHPEVFELSVEYVANDMVG